MVGLINGSQLSNTHTHTHTHTMTIVYLVYLWPEKKL